MPMAAPTAVALAPRVEVVDGQMRIVEQSLSIQAQPEASGRIITVEDNPVSGPACLSIVPASCSDWDRPLNDAVMLIYERFPRTLLAAD